jgi:lipopolysaccharide/colanic/teichoic acid biosynthesis glycosyltransferase
MFFTKVVMGVRKLAGLCSGNGLQLFQPADKLRGTLERERARADRTGDNLSLLTFAPRRPEDAHTTLTFLARVLRARLRATDESGWLDNCQIGVVLPNTTAQGAWKLADDICLEYLDDISPPVCTVYSYPSGRRTTGATHIQPTSNGVARSGDRATSADHAVPARPALELETFFVQRMPLWKRMLDVMGAAAGLLVLLPVFAAVAVAVKFSSPGPIFFRQRRSGCGGPPFVMYKFRTMLANAEAYKAALLALNEQDGPAFKIFEDPRITSVGRILRRTSLDELPQLWNVLKGDMSLVGPRPLPCEETNACESWHRRRLNVTPGLTCIWQVKGRSLVSFAEWVRMDQQYIRSLSMWQDVKLLLLTVPAVVSQKGAR